MDLPTIFAQILSFYAALGSAITCYECSSTNGQDCRYTSTTCSYGFFGCVKIATYSGGVDKLGNFYNQESRIVTMNRGCTVLPLGGVDACQQYPILGYRIVTCYCFTDFCNGSVSDFCSRRTTIAIGLLFLLLYWQRV